MIDTLVRRQRQARVVVHALSPEQFRRLSGTARASGIGAITRQPWSSLSQADPRQGLGWLVVETIRSPGNLGTILRTAEAVGMAGMICLSPAMDPFDPDVVRSSMGGIFRLRMIRTSHRSFEQWCREHGIRIVGLSPDGDTPWNHVLRGPCALVVGEERGGLTPKAVRMCESLIRLPMTGRADSLNVAVAAGVMMYELLRSAPLATRHAT